MQSLATRRRQDFWTSLVLIGVSLFFLWRTSLLPFAGARGGGVGAGNWYMSAGLVPTFIFGALLVLGVTLMVIALRQGGAPRGFPVWSWARSAEGGRILAAAIILLAYIFALVPRVDFILASALVILALIHGFHETRPRATLIALAAVMLPAAYALVVNFPSSRWATPHDDDWLVLTAFLLLILASWMDARTARGRIDPYLKIAPIISVLLPLLLICAMAFGFRQNVPNRTGLIFSQIEYHYYVSWRPWVQGQ